MFFDCTGLVAGLAASVISKWRPNERYSYGYARAEVLAGFVNGLFLLFIAFFILSEAVERAIEPPEVNIIFLYYPKYIIYATYINSAKRIATGRNSNLHHFV